MSNIEDLRAELARVTQQRDALLAERKRTEPIVAAAKAYVAALARMLSEGSDAEPPQKTPMFPPRLRYADPARARDFEPVVEKDTWPDGDDDDDDGDPQRITGYER